MLSKPSGKRSNSGVPGGNCRRRRSRGIDTSDVRPDARSAETRIIVSVRSPHRPGAESPPSNRMFVVPCGVSSSTTVPLGRLLGNAVSGHEQRRRVVASGEHVVDHVAGLLGTHHAPADGNREQRHHHVGHERGEPDVAIVPADDRQLDHGDDASEQRDGQCQRDRSQEPVVEREVDEVVAPDHDPHDERDRRADPEREQHDAEEPHPTQHRGARRDDRPVHLGADSHAPFGLSRRSRRRVLTRVAGRGERLHAPGLYGRVTRSSGHVTAPPPPIS